MTITIWTILGPLLLALAVAAAVGLWRDSHRCQWGRGANRCTDRVVAAFFCQTHFNRVVYGPTMHTYREGADL